MCCAVLSGRKENGKDLWTRNANFHLSINQQQQSAFGHENLRANKSSLLAVQ